MLSFDPTDTIAALASPPGPGLRGLVRLTGPDALAIALSDLSPDDGGDRGAPTRPTWRTGRLTVEGLRGPLPASLALWPGPRTYTGQPLAEIHTIGSPPLLHLVLAQCLARGARLAEPGEFTLRAFLAGRIDLTQAEAVLSVIDARNPAQLDAALRQLAGGLARPIAQLRDQLLDVVAHLEAGLDFVEEPDVVALDREVLAQNLAQAAEQITTLAHRLRGRDRAGGHPRVVLVGPPNAGKSCLFNALLNQPRALVSPQAGTTRDYLSALWNCDGQTIELIDTAGVEASSQPVMVQAQTLGRLQFATADLLLECRSADASAPPDLPSDRPRLEVWTKADLAPPPADRSGAIPTSARTGAGLDLLRWAIASALRDQVAEDDLPTSTAVRCRDALLHAGEGLQNASLTLALGQGGDELVAIDLRQAIDELGKVVGAVVTDDILDRIFQRFCIGK